MEGVNLIFLDEFEKSIIGDGFDVDEMVITNGSHGSRIVSDGEVKIDAVKCDDVVDTTGCGDTYMAAYISKRITDNSIEKSGRFASKVAAEKLKCLGHY